MRFYAGGDDSLIHEFTWDSASNVWGLGYTFPNSNGNAGAKRWPGSSNSVSYLYMQNTNYELELWWKEYDTSQTNSSTHPRGVWNQGKHHPTHEKGNKRPARVSSNISPFTGPVAAGIDIQPNSSLAMSYYAFFQDPSNQIVDIFPNASSEDPSWGASFIVGDGTHYLAPRLNVRLSIRAAIRRRGSMCFSKLMALISWSMCGRSLGGARGQLIVCLWIKVWQYWYYRPLGACRSSLYGKLPIYTPKVYCTFGKLQIYTPKVYLLHFYTPKLIYYTSVPLHAYRVQW